MKLDWIRAAPVDSLLKGMPALESGVRQDQVAGLGLNILAEDLPLPIAVLKVSALDANRAWMQAFVREMGVEICPHGKTTMCPELFSMQLDDGAFGMTCATASQLEVYRAAGVRRVIMANQLAGRTNLRMALRHLLDPTFDLFCLVDSTESAEALKATAQDLGLDRAVPVLLELGEGLARTGLRSPEQAQALARHICAMNELRIAGVATYEGVFAGDDPIEREAPAMRLLEETARAATLVEALVPPSAEPFMLSAGGSDYFDLVVDRFRRLQLGRPVRIVLRSGCYLTHDSGHYARGLERMLQRSPQMIRMPGSPRAALEVWGAVQSRPEPTRAYCTLGKRDISADWELPIPLWWRPSGQAGAPLATPQGWRVIKLNDQHLHLEVPADAPLRFGDLIAVGVSHPCTTFDKWRLIPLVDDAYNVVDVVRTFF